MKVHILVLVLAAVVVVECGHTFMGTSVMRRLSFHKTANYSANTFTKRIEYVNHTIPLYSGQSIQGILAYDLTHSGASVNVTSGGLGHNYVTLRMKSDRGRPLQDIEVKFSLYGCHPNFPASRALGCIDTSGLPLKYCEVIP